MPAKQKTWAPISPRLAVITLLVGGLTCMVRADDLPPASRAEQLLSKRGSLTLRNTSLADALFTISETWEVNLLFSEDISGNVSGVFRDVTLRELLGSVLIANGYGYRPKGQSLIVMSVEALGDTNAMLQSASVEIPNGQSADVMDAARLFLSPQGKVQAMASLNKLLVIDYPENIQQVQDFVRSLGRGATQPLMPANNGTVPILDPTPLQNAFSETSIAYFSPRHTTATSLQEAFTSFLGPQAKVVVIPDENRIAIVDSQKGLDLARQIFAELDQPRSQVRITALIYDVNVGELEKLGVNWTHNARIGGANQLFDGKFGASPDPTAGAFSLATSAAVDAVASSTTLGAARLTTLNRYLDLSAVISALDQVDGARLLANPSVTVIDREEASIRIVTEIPIQQLTQTSEGGSIGTTSFREAGVTLTVTPQIGSDGTITMNVMPTFSVLSGFSEGQPIIDSREASTTVRIVDGQTLVIGGLRQRSEVETVSGVPKLMRWKYFGKLFREHDTTVRESELIVFLRPEITSLDTIGSEREQAGLCVAHQALAKLNWPSELPVIPSCNDPNCPYHCPRPRLTKPAQVYSPAPIYSPTEPRLFMPEETLEFEGPVESFPAPEYEEESKPFTPAPFLPPEPVELDLSSTDSEQRWQDFLSPGDGNPPKRQASISLVSWQSREPKPKKKPDPAWPEWLQPLRPKPSLPAASLRR